ncbi:nephronectin [Austrofundulus limnaeus]|uniref:Nephronectin n=1 Tax=Austrofundulus limnaeus TaxID=52670 RepID=A0A2I4DCH8_AUSLI|nr:PREDICTED: nephronectin-like [Austrofundulus limnaeus]
MTSLVTSTLNNRINKDVTQRQRGDVHIPRHPGDNQVWEFDIELGNTAEDLRDDPDLQVFLRCRFDHGVCDWISDRDGDLLWETVRTSAGGQYLSVPELKAGQRSVRGARLAIQILPLWSHGDLCFSFSHWLAGRDVGVLQLFVRKTGRDQRFGSALWGRTGGHGWRQTQVTLAAQSVDRVLLKAERRRGTGGQVAVDDVTLRRGACR